MIPARQLLRSQGLRARKRLGQNFLTSPQIAGKIIDKAAITPGDVVWEVGAGLGALTVPAARFARKVIAVDKDARILDLLRIELASRRIANVELIEADFLRLPFERHLSKASAPVIVIGNLPYNISSQIIVRLIENRKFVRRAILMLQCEMADRLLAAPGGRDYGRLSVMLQYCADLQKVIAVDAVHFFPRPQVDSMVIEAHFRAQPAYPADNERLLMQVVKAAFGQRRKTLRNALRAGFPGLAPKGVDEWLSAVAIEARRRAETLEVKEFVELSNWLHRHFAAID
jgi:16S rRNA (adenine1518-N6/adenine1519-N6)-dimethyltransferase